MFLIAVIQLFLGEIPAQEIWLSRPRDPMLDSVGVSRNASCPICSLPQWWGACWLDGAHTLEVGTDFLSSLLLFISKCSCLSSLAACVFPLYYCSLLVFAGSFIFIFWTWPEMHLDFDIFRCLKPCTLLLMISHISQNSTWWQVYFARPCFFPFHH